MTMLSRHMNEHHHQQTQPALERRSVWKKVVSTINCCGHSRSSTYEVSDQYEPRPSSAAQTSTTKSTNSLQQRVSYVTDGQGKRSSPLATQSFPKKSPRNAISKVQRKVNTSSSTRKLQTFPKNREVTLIQPTNPLVNKGRPRLTNQPETTQLRCQSRGINLKDVSTIIKYAKSISFHTLQSLTPDGKESLNETIKRQKSFIKAFVKCQVKTPCHNVGLDQEFDRRHLQILPSLCRETVRSSAPQPSSSCLKLQDQENNINFNCSKNVIFVHDAALQRPIESSEPCDVSQITPAIDLVKMRNAHVRNGSIKTIIPTRIKPHSSSRIENACDQPLNLTPFPVSRELVPAHEPKPAINKEDSAGSRVVQSVAGSRNEVELDRSAAKAQTKVIRRQAKGVRHSSILRNEFLSEQVPNTCPEINATAQPVKVTAESVKRTTEPIKPSAELIKPSAELVKTSAEPTKPSAEPVKATAEPVITKAKPVKTSTEPGKATAELIKTSAEPVTPTAEPVIAKSQSVNATTEPVEGSAKPVKATAEIVKGTDEPVVIKSTPTPEKNVVVRKTPAAKLQQLFPECELLLQSDLQHVLDPTTNKPITLGRGAFGVVRLMKNINTGRLCAVKTFQDHLMNTKIFKDAKLEIQMLTKLRGLKCVPELFGIVPAEGNTGVPSVVQEFIGDQDTLMTCTIKTAIRKKIFSADIIVRVALSIVKALIDVQSRGICHCDLKPDNIMLMPELQGGQDPYIKVIDFGRAVSTAHKPKYEYLTPERQGEVLERSAHIAPEVVLGLLPYSEYSEIYSLGKIFIRMAGDRSKYLETIGKMCTNNDFRQRPTMKKLKEELTSYIGRKQC